MDENMVSTIKDYQRFFNLDTTGDIDNDTYQQILLPRCGLPGMNVTYDLPVNFSWPQGTLLFANSTKILTYGFDPRILNFTETTFKDGNIKIVFMDLSNNGTIGDEFGAALYEGSSFGIMVMDSSKTWVLPNVKTMQCRSNSYISLVSLVINIQTHNMVLTLVGDSFWHLCFLDLLPWFCSKFQLSCALENPFHYRYGKINVNQLYFGILKYH
ncbi:uncharacterized protein LOC110271993 [Arachis ipaensis]|uniref:uncharacterized protein LOC110271993 n=1 Tax=Arachis ipaensis TaxID=130454 RepID=UPI000A2B0C08|nr:uncharacterized protein LOC110271993 [Arachis ipaensis]